MEELIELLGKEYNPTWINLLVTITVTVIVTLILQGIFEKPIKKSMDWVKKKIRIFFKKIINTPKIKERILYFRIILHERKKDTKSKRPYNLPINMRLKDQRIYSEKINSGESFAYARLEKKLKWYQDSYSERLEEYYDKNADEKLKSETVQKYLKKSMYNLSNRITNSSKRL